MRTCKWYVSIEQVECGDPAPHSVRVRTKATDVTVDLCDRHKSVNDERFAAIRAAQKAARKSATSTV